MKETKLTVKLTTTFKKDYKMAMKRGRKLELIDKVIRLLPWEKTFQMKIEIMIYMEIGKATENVIFSRIGF